MKYLVMECKLTHAIVLDENGKFIKVANFNYEVGQTVSEIVEMNIPQQQNHKANIYKWMSAATAAVACLIMMIALYANYSLSPYASVYMTINPEVRIDVNRKNIVVDIEGLNDDGKKLITDYAYKNKQLDPVIDDLVDLAMKMGYLSDGDKITLHFDAENDEWISSVETNVVEQLKEHISNDTSINVNIQSNNTSVNEINIPITTETPTVTNVPSSTQHNYSESDYDTLDNTLDDDGLDDDDLDDDSSDDIDDDSEDVDDDNDSEYTAPVTDSSTNNIIEVTTTPSSDDSDYLNVAPTENNSDYSGDSIYDDTDDETYDTEDNDD